jgi:hypothetical protein
MEAGEYCTELPELIWLGLRDSFHDLRKSLDSFREIGNRMKRCKVGKFSG